MSNGNVRIYSISDRQLTDTFKSGNSIFYMKVDATGKNIVILGNNGQLFVWSLADKKLKHQLTGHTKAVFAVSIHPVLPLVITGSYDRNVKCWNMETGECLLTLSGVGQEIYTVSIAKDGKRVVITETEGKIQVIDL